MDLRAKQRLTGAVILVALFVLVVPPMLDGPRDAQAPAPGEASNEGMQEYTIDIGEQNRRAQPAAPTAPVPAIAAPPASNAQPSPDRAAPGEAAQPEPTPAAPPATNPMSAATAPANPTRDTPPPAPAPAPATRVETPPAAAAVTPGSFVVQLGTFSVRENAEGLVRDMKAKGFAAFLVPTTSNGRTLYRVRVGPTRDRASAEALAADLKRAGQPGSIVPIT